MKEQGDVSYKDDVASWGDLAQSRHCPHLLKWSSTKEISKQTITVLNNRIVHVFEKVSQTLYQWSNEGSSLRELSFFLG